MSSKLREALEKLNAVDLSWLEFPLDGDSSTIYNSNKKEITIPYWRVAELLNVFDLDVAVRRHNEICRVMEAGRKALDIEGRSDKNENN